MTKTVASAKYIRISARKVRFVVDSIKKMPPLKALDYLHALNKRSAQPIAKVIQSAIANAEHNFQLKKEDLQFVGILVEEGPTLKRWQPISRGRAFPINKRTSHIKVILEGKEEGDKKLKIKS